MVLPELARTLELLARLGPEAFYQGPIAEALLAEMKRGQGLITAADLADYSAAERTPLVTRYRGVYDVYAPPAPSAGGVCLIEELNLLETFDLAQAERWSPRTLHLMAEVMRRATRDRARFLGDPAFVEVPEWLTSKQYAQTLAATINPKRATPSELLAQEIVLPHESPSTTHFSVIDRDGMAVSNTYTLERRWGSRIVVKGMGFLLNNDMRAFNLFPGETDRLGNVGTTPNTIAPRKRPITSMAPTIVAKEGRVTLVTGSPGSRAIPHTILSILVSVLDYGLPLDKAVLSPRLSHVWFPDQLSLESPESLPGLVVALQELGHTVVAPAPMPFQGDAHTIQALGSNTFFGVADARISGKAVGY